MLEELRHENVVEHRGGVDGHIVMEYVDGGSLLDVMERSGGALSEAEVIALATQILKGLSYIHAKGVIHRDIKPANILFDSSTRTAKIADIATAAEVQSASRHGVAVPVGTPAFLAPEVVRSGQHVAESDIWAVGCTVLQLLTGKLPWDEEDNQFAALFKIGHGQHPPIPSDISADAASFLRACFQPCAARASAHDLLAHPFLADLPPAGPQL